MEQPTSGVPAPAHLELRRERLLGVLHKHHERPLIMLVAPAGYGKSTLAATYARESGRAVVWLTLEAADRDTRRLFGRLARQLEIGFEHADAARELRRGLDEGAEGVGLTRLLLGDLARARTGFIIVLDDFQEVDESDDVTQAVDMLIRELPEAGQVVVTARESPALEMVDYLLGGVVFPVGIEDLRFNPDETRQLRGKIRSFERSLPRGETGAGAEPHVSGDARDEARAQAEAEERAHREADEDRRDELAEGWVAGILLGGAPLLLGARGRSLLGGYVEREILARLSETEREWLESLSVFDQITPRAADRLLGAGPWQSRLIGLAERCPFLIPREDSGYRLHGLVRNTVLAQLRRDDDRWQQAWNVVREMGEEAGDPVVVVRACQQLSDIERAVALIRRCVADAVQRGRWNAVVVTLDLLPSETRYRHADLLLVEARALLNTGKPHQALEVAETALNLGGSLGDESVQIAALIELAQVTVYTDLSVAHDWLEPAEVMLRNSASLPNKRLLEGRALGVRAIICAQQADNDGARNAWETAERLLKLVGPSRDLALVQQNFGSFCNRTGDFTKAQVALGSAAAHWRRVGDHNGLATTQSILGDLMLRVGDIEAAGSAQRDAVTSAKSIGAQRIEAFATTSLGQWHRASGRINDAIAEFDKSIELTARIVEREEHAHVLALRAEMAILQGDLTSARRYLALGQSEAQVSRSSSAVAIVDRALGRLHMADDAADKAISFFESALARGGIAWGPDERAEALYWLGTANLTLNHSLRATECLDQAIEIARQADLPAMLAQPVAEDSRLLEKGRSLGRHAAFLADVERLAVTRRPWSGAVARERPVVVVRNELPRIEVKLFGSFELYVDGQLLGKASRKDRARELAAALILNPKGLPDHELAEMMFGDRVAERMRHNLQTAAWALRKQIGSLAVQYGARTYQLNPGLDLRADAREFEDALARSRGAIGNQLIQTLSRACDLYRGRLVADAAWEWLGTPRAEYQARFVEAAVRLADSLAPSDSNRSDAYAEKVLAEAPDTDLAYVRLILNARSRRDQNAARFRIKQYVQAAEQHGFSIDRNLLDDHGQARAAR